MGLGNEAVEGSKMGTLFIMFVAIVVIALAGFTLGKNLVNTGLDNMQTTVQQVTDSRFSDYNNKVVRGSKVKSAIELFANEEVAILVDNLAYADDNTIEANLGAAAAKTSYGTILVGTDGTPGTSFVPGQTTIGADKNAMFLNYNAILAADSSGNLAQGAFDGSVIFKESTTGSYVFLQDFKTLNGQVQFNLATSNINKKGNVDYIADAASYNASLIKNSAGEIMGIAFVQRKLG